MYYLGNGSRSGSKTWSSSSGLGELICVKKNKNDVPRVVPDFPVDGHK